MYSQNRFQKIQEYFQRARKLDESDRSALLEEASRDDPTMRDEIESLLAADKRSESGPLNSAALARDALLSEFIQTEAAPNCETVGSYRIIDRLGVGGMGIVYQARQKGTNRPVALKLIRSELATPSTLRRFKHEAEVLGRLRHPGIAQVYESGIHQSDTSKIPFIAMELVVGPTILQFVKEQDLTIRQRIELFIHCCDAVQHAHQKGVVHRDLKPDNILIDTTASRPQPKILDFGIARLTDSDNATPTIQTQFGTLLGTVAYMSPEQASGDPFELDTRTDVYALGIILYQLLTDRLPYDLNASPLHESVRIICEQPPIPPANVNQVLRGDLSTIICKSLEKDRQNRYQSASELAADLQRFLRDEPIQAHPPSSIYQLRKFARRNRGLVLATLTVAAVLIVGIIATTHQAVIANRARHAEARQRQQAERRLEDIRQMARTMIFDISEKLTDIPGALDARRQLAETGRQYLDRISADREDQFQRDIELATAYIRLGDIFGEPLRSNLGDSDQALASYKRGLSLLEPHLGEPAASAHTTASLALCKIGDVLMRKNRFDDAVAPLRRARELALMCQKSNPQDPGVLRGLSLAQDRYAKALTGVGRIQEAQEEGASAWQIVEQLTETQPDNWRLRHDRAVRVFKNAQTHLANNRLPEARAALEQYISLLNDTRKLVPHHRSIIRDLSVGYSNLGLTQLRLGDLDQAEASQRTSIRLGQSLVDADSKDAGAKSALCAPYCRLGELLSASGRHEEALACFEQYNSLAEQVAKLASRDPSALREWAVSLYKLGQWRQTAAERLNDSIEQKRDHLIQAREMFQAGYAVFADMKKNGILAESDASAPDELKLAAQQCTEALSKLEITEGNANSLD